MPSNSCRVCLSCIRFDSIESHDETGNRINFFRDDSVSTTLEDLVSQERMESRHASDIQFASMAGKCRRGPEDEYDDAFISKKSISHDVARQRQKANAVSDYKRKEFALANCSKCLERTPKYLVMSVGQREIVPGILEEFSSKWRRPKPDSPENLREKAVDFEQCCTSVDGPGTATCDAVDDTFEPEGPTMPPSMQSA